MSHSITMRFLSALLTCSCAGGSWINGAHAQAKPKVKLAVFRITFIEVAETEQERLRATLYEHLRQDQRTELRTEAESRAQLVALGKRPEDMNQDADYLEAARYLQVDYILLGHFEKIGNFVRTNFRIFPRPTGTDSTYEGGQLNDMLAQEEIPKIQRFIHGSVIPPIEEEPLVEKNERKRKWPWLVLGGVGVGGGVALAALLGPDKTEKEAPLPRPPIVP